MTIDACGLRAGGYEGAVRSADPLVAFLYTLMRDHTVPGIVEELVYTANEAGESDYSNDFLAAYAISLAARLNGADPVLARHTAIQHLT